MATCHCQLKLKLSLQPSRAEPSRAERPINSCAQLSHLSTQSISHNGNSRQRRLIDRAGIQSRLPFPHPASPCLAAFRNRSHNPIAQLDPLDPPHKHRISFDGISIFHFGSEFVTYRSRPRPLCNPRGWHRSSACSSQFQLPHSPTPCLPARCSLSALRLINENANKA